MKNNKVAIPALVVSMVLFIGIFIYINGIDFTIAGLFSINTKFYNTPEEAAQMQLTRSVDYIQIDENNGVFIGVTDENESEDYIFLCMRTKDDKYFWLGDCMLMEYDPTSEDILKGPLIYMYNRNGGCIGRYEYFVVYDKNNLQELDESYTVQHITSGSNEEFYFVYRIV